MNNVFPATRMSLDPVGTVQSIAGANVFNGTVALPAHWHLHLRDEIIVAGTDVGRIGGVIEHLPAPAIQEC